MSFESDIVAVDNAKPNEAIAPIQPILSNRG
jgi:hypothetical protein